MCQRKATIKIRPNTIISFIYVPPFTHYIMHTRCQSVTRYIHYIVNSLYALISVDLLVTVKSLYTIYSVAHLLARLYARNSRSQISNRYSL